MLSAFAKGVLGGLAFGIVAGFVAAACDDKLKKQRNKKEEENPDVITIDEDGNPVEEESEPNFFDKMKKSAMEAGVKFVNWLVEHQKQVEAVSVGVSLIASLFNLRNKILNRPSRRGADTGLKDVSRKKDIDIAQDGTIIIQGGSADQLLNIIRKRGEMHIEEEDGGYIDCRFIKPQEAV